MKHPFSKISFVALLCSAALFSSCSKSDGNETVKADLEVKTVADLNGSGGQVYYSLVSNKEIAAADANTTNWDIAFSSTNIYVNSGTSGKGNVQGQLTDGTFTGITVAPSSGWAVDASGTLAIAKTWYSYTGTAGTPANAILITPGKIILVKTADNKYAKIEMLSYYKGNPSTSTTTFASLDTRPAARYYTFKYAIQTDGTTNLK